MSKQIQRSRRCSSLMISCQKGWYKSSHTLLEVLPCTFEEDFRWLITLTEWDCLYMKTSKCCHASVNYCNRFSVAEIKSEYMEKMNSKRQVPVHAYPLFLLCAVALCPRCSCAQARGDRQTHEEQVWLHVDFTHFWWPLSALELPYCSPRLLLDCVLSSLQQPYRGFLWDALVCSHVLMGSGIALTSLRKGFQSVLKVLSGALTCLFVSSSPAM